MTTEQRLDATLEMLRRASPALDELTRARVGARLQDAIAADGGAASATARPRRVVAGLALGGALAAAAAVVLLVRGRGDDAAGGAASEARTEADRAPSPAATGGGASSPAAPAPAEATAPVVVAAAAGESRRAELDGTAITVFGPGRVDASAREASADGGAILVDRPGADAPWTLRYRGIEMIATRTTFAVDGGTIVRATVIRGELILRCPSGDRTIGAGSSGTCDPETAPLESNEPAEAAAASGMHPRSAREGADRLAAGAVTAAGGDRIAAGARTATGARAGQEAADRIEGDTTASSEVRPPTPDAAALYMVAEEAMRRGDRAEARVALLAVIEAAPDSIDGAAALLDLARLEEAVQAAQAYLDRLDRHPRGAALAAAAAKLRERLAARAADAAHE